MIHAHVVVDTVVFMAPFAMETRIFTPPGILTALQKNLFAGVGRPPLRRAAAPGERERLPRRERGADGARDQEGGSPEGARESHGRPLWRSVSIKGPRLVNLR